MSRLQVPAPDEAAAGAQRMRGAGYTDPQIPAIVTVAVQVPLTNVINDVNQTDIDIPAVNPAG